MSSGSDSPTMAGVPSTTGESTHHPVSSSSSSATTAAQHSVSRVLEYVFGSCANDPTGSVHRAWGISLIFVLVYFCLSIVEMINLNSLGGSRALVIASVWTGVVHLMLAVLGTFILKRFPTSFSVGFLLGLLLVLANQNLIFFGTFHRYHYGVPATNQAFGGLAFTLFLVLTFFGTILFHFKNYIVVAPIDAKGFSGSRSSTPRTGGGAGTTNNHKDDAPTSNYRQYDDEESEA